MSGLYRTLELALDDMVWLKKSGKITATLIAGAIFGGVMFVWILSSTEIARNIIEKAAYLLLMSGLCVVSLFYLINGLKEKYIVINKKNGTVAFKQSVNIPNKGRLICRVADVGAIQLCNETKYQPRGRGIGHEVIWYEVNMVLFNGKRIFLTGGGDTKNEIYAMANQLAGFFVVPLLDHTQKLESDES
jgi:hypothetical protein